MLCKKILKLNRVYQQITTNSLSIIISEYSLYRLVCPFVLFCSIVICNNKKSKVYSNAYTNQWILLIVTVIAMTTANSFTACFSAYISAIL